MMINDEQLTLYFYDDELDVDERRRISAALAHDEALAARYAVLRADLQLLQRDSYENTVSNEFAAALHTVLVEAQPPARTSHPWRWAVAASLVAAVALTVMLAPRGSHAPAPIAQTVPAVPQVWPSSSQKIVVAHLAQSRLQLVRYDAADTAQRDELIRELVAQNRSIEHTARRNGDEDLARVLRAFETVLERLADAPQQARERELLLDQLTFEVNAMLTKFDASASDSTISF